MKQFTSIVAAVATLTSLVPTVHGHGFVTSPTPRYPGAAFEAACGQQAYDTETADIYGNVQNELTAEEGQSDYNAAECDIFLCKGFKYADNNVTYSYTSGEVVDFEVTIQAPHTGVANVSVVDTSSNTVIGNPLISWSVYASTATGVAANNTKFSVTIPDDLSDKCSTGGDCVLQWYWYAASIDQTYEACVDFTVDESGSGSTSSSSSTSSPSSSTTSSVSVESSSSSVPTSSSSSVPSETPAVETTPAVTSTPAESTTAVASTSDIESTTPALVATSTFATKVRASVTPSGDSGSSSTTGVATSIPIPVNGSAEQKLTWIESVFKYLVDN
ncbi:hypothetical protein N7540_002726 [Penicillium herquei]|nr:hypothetical protein N7540_002726 [Penicillium herquei]